MFPDAHGMTPSPPSRTFEQYRYAIEAGLISPHDVRCYVPAWERSPATEATTAGTRARAGKRYHDSEDDYAETVEDDDENQGIAREASRRRFRRILRPIPPNELNGR